MSISLDPFLERRRCWDARLEISTRGRRTCIGVLEFNKNSTRADPLRRILPIFRRIFSLKSGISSSANRRQSCDRGWRIGPLFKSTRQVPHIPALNLPSILNTYTYNHACYRNSTIEWIGHVTFKLDANFLPIFSRNVHLLTYTREGSVRMYYSWFSS